MQLSLSIKTARCMQGVNARADTFSGCFVRVSGIQKLPVNLTTFPVGVGRVWVEEQEPG
jgi:hypothetical protein